MTDKTRWYRLPARPASRPRTGGEHPAAVHRLVPRAVDNPGTDDATRPRTAVGGDGTVAS
jgi:hypothetical protein